MTFANQWCYPDRLNLSTKTERKLNDACFFTISISSHLIRVLSINIMHFPNLKHWTKMWIYYKWCIFFLRSTRKVEVCWFPATLIFITGYRLAKVLDFWTSFIFIPLGILTHVWQINFLCVFLNTNYFALIWICAKNFNGKMSVWIEVILSWYEAFTNF